MATRVRDAAWLDDVRMPGPNGETFFHLAAEDVMQATGGDIMEDDTNTGEFTPGCRAYAGYGPRSSFANMGAVVAYARSQGASAFSYTPQPDGNCNALDMEPGDASPGQFHDQIAARKAKGLIAVGYGSASWVSAIKADAVAHGYRQGTDYLIVSAHYIGPHICGPSSCGYSQADATQFTDTYQGRSLDGTLMSAAFISSVFGGGPSPSSTFPLQVGSSGPDVITLQKNLNRWASLIHLTVPLETATGQYGPFTKAAVILAQGYFHDTSAPSGECSQVLYNELAKALPSPPPPPPVPSFSVTPLNQLRLIDLDLAVVPGTVNYLITSSPSVPNGEKTVTAQKVTYQIPLTGTVVITCQAIGTNGQAIAQRKLTIS